MNPASGITLGTKAAATSNNSVEAKSFRQHSKENNNPEDLEKLKKHKEIIILNLVYVTYQFN